MKKPNVLIVLLDGCRADRLGCYGYTKRKTSPNIDRIAKNAVVACNNYSTSYCTMPAIMSMMTGMYPCVHKASSTFSFYDGKYPFLTEILQKNGYYTFGISNNIAAMSPEWGFIRGYDRYYRIGKSSNWFKESKEEQRGVKKTPFNVRIKRGIIKTLNKLCMPIAQNIEKRSQLKHYLNNDMGGEKAVETFARALEERENDKPFFGYINLPDTHSPYLSPNMDCTPTYNLLQANLNPVKFKASGKKLNSNEIEMLNYLYDKCVLYIDSLVGKVYEHLNRFNLLDDTVVIFTSDHGGMLYEHNEYIAGANCSLEGEIKTCAIISNLNKSSKIKKITSVIDLFPTILNILGIKHEHEYCHGIDILSDKAHDSILIDYPVFDEFLMQDKKNNGLRDIACTNRTLINNELQKFIWTTKGKYFYFDLKVDPNEQNNLCESEKDLFRMSKIIEKYREVMKTQNFDLGVYQHNSIGERFKNIPSMNKVNPNFKRESLVYC